MSRHSVVTAVPEIARLLAGAQVVVCATHEVADADGLGSALAFALALRSAGRQVSVAVPEPVPQHLSWLPGFELVGAPPPGPDLVITFDCSAARRLDECSWLVEGQPWPVINIDHHATNHDFGTVNVVQPELPASGEVTYRLLRRLGVDVDAGMATCLYAALYRDTKAFSEARTTPATMRIAADLVRRGAPAAEIGRRLRQLTPAQLALLGEALHGMQPLLDDRLLCITVDAAMLRRTGAQPADCDAVHELIEDLDGGDVAVVLTEAAADHTEVWMRSRTAVDVGALCTKFGGGGHRDRAGAQLPMSLARARHTVIEAVSRALGSAEQTLA